MMEIESSVPILLNKQNNIAYIILNKPEKNNAINAEIISLFTKYLTEIKEDTNIKLVILSGSGNNFSSGADLDWMRQAINFSPAENITDANNLAHMLELFNTLPQPTIGIINGSVYGGAIGLVACCDIALANQNTKFCFAEVKLGLAPAIISPFVVPIIGIKSARRLMLTAEVFDCHHALQIGLIDEIITIETVELKLAELSALLLSNSSSAMAATKKLLLDLAFNYSQPIKDQTVNLIAELRTSTDAQTRLQNFLKLK